MSSPRAYAYSGRKFKWRLLPRRLGSFDGGGLESLLPSPFLRGGVGGGALWPAADRLSFWEAAPAPPLTPPRKRRGGELPAPLRPSPQVTGRGIVHIAIGLALLYRRLPRRNRGRMASRRLFKGVGRWRRRIGVPRAGGPSRSSRPRSIPITRRWRRWSASSRAIRRWFLQARRASSNGRWARRRRARPFCCKGAIARKASPSIPQTTFGISSASSCRWRW